MAVVAVWKRTSVLASTTKIYTLLGKVSNWIVTTHVLARKDAGSAPGMHATAPALSTGVATTSPSTGSIMTSMDTAPMWLFRTTVARTLLVPSALLLRMSPAVPQVLPAPRP